MESKIITLGANFYAGKVSSVKITCGAYTSSVLTLIPTYSEISTNRLSIMRNFTVATAD